MPLLLGRVRWQVTPAFDHSVLGVCVCVLAAGTPGFLSESEASCGQGSVSGNPLQGINTQMKAGETGRKKKEWIPPRNRKARSYTVLKIITLPFPSKSLFCWEPVSATRAQTLTSSWDCLTTRWGLFVSSGALLPRGLRPSTLRSLHSRAPQHQLPPSAQDPGTLPQNTDSNMQEWGVWGSRNPIPPKSSSVLMFCP